MPKNRFINRIWLVVFAGLLGSFSWGYGGEDKPKLQDKDDVYKQLDLFADVFSYIKNDYVEAMDNKDLVYGALKGMLGSLDAHSQFLPPDVYDELKVDTRGKFGGLGIEITLEEGLITIVTPLEDTPAWRVGLKSGDKIVRIDGEITRGFSLTDAVHKMRGKPGTDVRITVLREEEEKLLDFKITRAIIKIEDIKGARILEDGIAYVRLTEFRERTGAELAKALKKLSREGMRALIVDLRNNPGGLLTAAVDVAEEFIERGKVIVSTKGRDAGKNIEFKARGRRPLLGLPMIVLINQGSASGSEIVAGCLKDYKRAIILGEKSFGKGSVQTLIPLADGSAIKLTTSKYFTPSGRSIHKQGIIPDIVVPKVSLPGQDKQKDNKNKKAEEIFDKIEHKENDKGVDKKDDYENDNQLLSAVEVLKGMLFMQEKKQPTAKAENGI